MAELVIIKIFVSVVVGCGSGFEIVVDVIFYLVSVIFISVVDVAAIVVAVVVIFVTAVIAV